MPNRTGWVGTFAALAALSLGACDRSKVDAVDPAAEHAEAPLVTTCKASPRLAFVPTSKIEGSAAFHAKVDALAQFSTVDSSGIGAGGSRSDSYRAYHALEEALTEAQATALLLHESPIVRGYMLTRARAQANEVDVDPMRFAPLLRDDAVVDTRSGCSGLTLSMGEHVLWRFGDLDERGAALYRLAAEDKGLCMARARALAHLLPTDPSMRASAEDVLRAGDGAMAVIVLDALDRSDLAPALSRVLPFVTHADPRVRAAAATMLGHYQDRASLALVEMLRRDPSTRVEDDATSAYVRHPLHDRAEIARLFAEDDRSFLAGGLAYARDDGDLALLFEDQKKHSSGRVGYALIGAARSSRSDPAPGFVPMVRKMLAEIPALHAGALCALQALGDRASLPAFLAALPSKEPADEGALCAMTALGELGETSAIPRLEALLTGAAREGDRVLEREIIVGAARALLALRSKSSAALVEKATTGYPPDDRALRAIAEKLGAL